MTITSCVEKIKTRKKTLFIFTLRKCKYAFFTLSFAPLPLLPSEKERRKERFYIIPPPLSFFHITTILALILIKLAIHLNVKLLLKVSMYICIKIWKKGNQSPRLLQNVRCVSFCNYAKTSRSWLNISLSQLSNSRFYIIKNYEL